MSWIEEEKKDNYCDKNQQSKGKNGVKKDFFLFFAKEIIHKITDNVGGKNPNTQSCYPEIHQ
jgi:hypothetical protein